MSKFCLDMDLRWTKSCIQPWGHFTLGITGKCCLTFCTANRQELRPTYISVAALAVFISSSEMLWDSFTTHGYVVVVQWQPKPESLNRNLNLYAVSPDPQPYPRNLRTHILRLLGPKTILYMAFGQF